jgi:predicted Ser/Thr protein kinase
MATEPFPLVPGHTILSELGRGGMARVYLAREERLRRLVALKVIAERLDGSDEFRRRFDREARTAAGLSHPNIVPVYAYGITEAGSPYISMAFLDGGSLRERLRKHGPMRVDDALPIVRQVASALQAAHARNVVHRDLKPDNVMFQGENALLTDFGIAKVLDSTTELTGTGVSPGTVSYFSPEQARGEALDQRSDIYTLGVVLYEMLTGRLPIEASTYPAFIHRIVAVEPTPLPEQLAGLQPFLDRLLSKDPADRLHTCGEVTAIIDAMLGNWMRNGSVDRVTDGVEMRPSGQQAARRDLDGVPAASSSAPGHATPDASTIAMPSGHTEPTIAISAMPAPAPTNTPPTVSIEGMPSRADRADPAVAGAAGRSMAMSTRAALGAGVLLIAGVAAGVWIGRSGTAEAPPVQAALPAPMQAPVVQAPLQAPSAAGTTQPAAMAGTAPLSTPRMAPAAANTAPPRSAEDPQRNTLLARIAGRWAFAGSSKCAEFVIDGTTLVQRWPGLAEARERVTSAERGIVRTTVELPVEQRGQHYTYTPLAAGSLEVHDVKRGRSDILDTCGATH